MVDANNLRGKVVDFEGFDDDTDHANAWVRKGCSGRGSDHSGSLARSLSQIVESSTFVRFFGGSNPLESSARATSHSAADQEALTWAALEKLPTHTRLRTTVTKLSDVVRHVLVKDLSTRDFEALLQRLQLPRDDEDRHLLAKMRNRLDRVGIELPSMEVRYENLSLGAKCQVGSRGLSTLWNVVLDFVESVLDLFHLSRSSKHVLTILDNVSGSIKPGRMTLLLGPPSSGKATLLQALAGKLITASS